LTSSAIRSGSLTGRSPDDGDESTETSIPISRSRTAVAASLRPENRRVAQPTQLRHQIEHDIRHQLSTVMLLAALLNTGDDVGPESRTWADQILGETRWLHQLMTALDDCLAERETAAPPMHGEPIRLDALATEVVAAVQLSTFTRIVLDVQEAWAHVDRLAFWRALRNLVDNAVRAAGPRGMVRVRISRADGWAVTQIDDNGPGFGAGPPGMASLGLGIVQNLVAANGGDLGIRRGALGGCCVRLQLPAVSTESPSGTDDP
jgi:signal transduction histidine kinase